MKKQLSIFIAIAFIASSCGNPGTENPVSTPQSQSTEIVLPTVTPVCISPGPTQDDIDRALAYTGDAFSPPDWVQSDVVSDTTVAVTWQNVNLGAVVYLEALIFPCGYEEPDLNNYYNDQNWKALFQNYESYAPVAECRTDKGTRLYKFKAQNQGFEYDIKYWVQNDTANRVISTMIVIPVGSESLIDDLSFWLFPTLPNCS
jgi:hypothetical protein